MPALPCLVTSRKKAGLQIVDVEGAGDLDLYALVLWQLDEHDAILVDPPYDADDALERAADELYHSVGPGEDGLRWRVDI